MMKAIVCRSFGDLSALKLETIEEPSFGADEVLIAVNVASVSFMDWLMTDGRYQLKPELPYTPGTDAAGVVVGAGRNVTRFKIGDRVACSTWYGAYAEMMKAPEGACVKIPDAVGDIDAANVLYAYGTAFYALVRRAQLLEREVLFVTGATGGVGLAALEIGALLGATVIAGVGSAHKAALAREYGASSVVNYRREDVRSRIRELTNDNGIDVCFEVIGGELFEKIARSMAWNGRLLPIGFASGTIPNIQANLPLIKNYSIIGSAAGPWWERCRDEAILEFETIFSWLAEGKIHPRTDRVMALDQAVEAMELVRNREVQGRIALHL